MSRVALLLGDYGGLCQIKPGVVVNEVKPVAQMSLEDQLFKRSLAGDLS